MVNQGSGNEVEGRPTLANLDMKDTLETFLNDFIEWGAKDAQSRTDLNALLDRAIRLHQGREGLKQTSSRDFSASSGHFTIHARLKAVNGLFEPSSPT